MSDDGVIQGPSRTCSDFAFAENKTVGEPDRESLSVVAQLEGPMPYMSVVPVKLYSLVLGVFRLEGEGVEF